MTHDHRQAAVEQLHEALSAVQNLTGTLGFQEPA